MARGPGADSICERKIIELRKQGLRTEDIAIQAAVSIALVYRICKKHGITRAAGYYVYTPSKHRSNMKCHSSGRCKMQHEEYWDSVPSHIRITGRSRDQSIPSALNQE